MKITQLLFSITLLSFTSCENKDQTLTDQTSEAGLTGISQPVSLMEAVGNNQFIIQNTEDAEIPVYSVYMVEEFQSQVEKETFKIVITAPLNATDFGPYKDVYLVYHNGYEMPSRMAVFKVGSVGDISSIRRLTADSFQFNATLFTPGSAEGYDNYYDRGVNIEVSVKDVFTQNQKLDNENSGEEGHLSSMIVVRVK